MIAYHPVYPGDDGSPLKKDINETDCLELAYGQNTFSLDVASINYDYPSNILYSWKIDGYHKEWTRPSQDNRIVVRNLPPGSYTLQIRTVSNEEKYKEYSDHYYPSGVGQYVGNGGVCNSGGLDYDYHIPCYHVA